MAHALVDTETVGQVGDADTIGMGKEGGDDLVWEAEPVDATVAQYVLDNDEQLAGHGDKGLLRVDTRGQAVILLVMFASGCHISPLERAREQVAIGTTRDEAIRILGEGAWYHQECRNRITIDALFFYGSRKYDDADVVIVGSEPIDGVFVVYDISSFESYAWHAAYQDCLQRAKFED